MSVVIIAQADLRKRGIPFSRQWLDKLERDGRFPKRVRIGRRVGYVESEINEYLQRCVDARETA